MTEPAQPVWMKHAEYPDVLQQIVYNHLKEAMHADPEKRAWLCAEVDAIQAHLNGIIDGKAVQS